MGLEGFPEQILEETASDNEHAPFAPGERVTVRRTSGAIEDDWTFKEINSKGWAVVEKREGKDILTKEYPLRELEDLNNDPSPIANQQEQAVGQERNTLSYDEVYFGDSGMRLAVESLQGALFPNGRTYEIGSPESKAVFLQLMDMLKSAEDLSALVQEIAKKEVGLTEKLNDPSVSESRKEIIRDQLAYNRQRNEGFKKIRERLS